MTHLPPDEAFKRAIRKNQLRLAKKLLAKMPLKTSTECGNLIISVMLSPLPPAAPHRLLAVRWMWYVFADRLAEKSDTVKDANANTIANATAHDYMSYIFQHACVSGDLAMAKWSFHKMPSLMGEMAGQPLREIMVKINLGRAIYFGHIAVARWLMRITSIPISENDRTQYVTYSDIDVDPATNARLDYCLLQLPLGDTPRRQCDYLV